MSLERRYEITRVVSLEVPHTYAELIHLIRGFLPFACCFALLVWIWYEHSAFFSRYALHDRVTTVLNAVLLFVVLFYVYPLKYLCGLTRTDEVRRAVI